MPVAGETLHGDEEALRFVAAAGRELVVRTLPGQKRPRPADADAVERRTVFVLAIAVAVVTAPARPGRQLDLEQRVDHL
jgi:hypothetical protein